MHAMIRKVCRLEVDRFKLRSGANFRGNHPNFKLADPLHYTRLCRNIVTC